jgi:4-hydroxy-tetrahydrodipicolinate synthase
MVKFSGCYTALVTPMTQDRQVDYEGLSRLVEFQIKEGVSGILAVGTTGESPTLDWNEHNKVIEEVYEYTGSKGLTIAGTGSNSTQETVEGTEHAVHIGVQSVLLVDPYYNGPSSLEIRREYVEPVAKQFPEVQVIPYVIPGRTGTQLYPQDIAVLHQQYPNVSCVKEATGNVENMRLTRKLCGSDFAILSGDDDKTFVMMTAPDIAAAGVISVASNIVPHTVQSLTQALRAHRTEEANRLYATLKPLFNMVPLKHRSKPHLDS